MLKSFQLFIKLFVHCGLELSPRSNITMEPAKHIKELQFPPSPYSDSKTSIIRKTGNQYWFGDPEPKTFPLFLLGAACFIMFILVMILLEPRPPGEAERFVIIVVVAGVLLVIALFWGARWGWNKSPLTAMLDMEAQSFGVIEFYTGRLKQTVPCKELMLFLEVRGHEQESPVVLNQVIEVRKAASDELGSNKSTSETGPDSDFPVVFASYFDEDAAIQAARILMEALPWHGIDGDLHLMSLWQEQVIGLQYEKMVEVLLQRIPEFASVCDDTEHPDSVHLNFGNFARFLYDRIVKGEESGRVIEDSFKLLNEMVNSNPQGQVANLALVGTLDILGEFEATERVAKKFLTGQALKGFNKLMEEKPWRGLGSDLT